MYIAQKPCTFAGTEYNIGDTIPKDKVLPEAVTRLIKNGVIAEVGNAGPLLPASTSLEVPIVADEGAFVVKMTVDELVGAVHTIQKTEEEIVADIEEVENADVLIFIDVMTGKKEAIHEAAKARAEAISGPQEPEAPEIPETEKELMALTRKELVEFATFLGMEVEDKHTKQMLTDYILEAKQGSDE